MQIDADTDEERRRKKREGRGELRLGHCRQGMEGNEGHLKHFIRIVVSTVQ